MEETSQLTDEESSVWRHLIAPFWNEKQGRFRAFWRILTAVLVALVSAGVIGAYTRQALDFPLSSFISNLLAVVSALLILYIWAGYIDHRRFKAFGFRINREWIIDLVGGILIAGVIHLGVFVTHLSLGWIEITGWMFAGSAESFVGGFVLSLFGFVFVAVWEESIFRGLFLKNAAEGLGSRWVSAKTGIIASWVLVSIIFGFLHLNQAPSLISIVVWILPGAILGLAYILTGELGLPIGIHIMYNFALNNVFGIAGASLGGEVQPSTLIRVSLEGPNGLVGITGIIHLVFGVIGLFLVVGWVYWRRREVGLRKEIAEWSGS
ncbi:MAG: type II CAAX endopeptidase family protein [Halobacteria archaeon]|nr:type II CAAX endopeptidase family protein [Halobacteria archaeon]